MDRDPLLIIGIGNTLRGDDGAGPAAAEALRKHGLDALAVHQLTPELAERIAAARVVFFLDADARLPAGEVSVVRLAEGRSAIEHVATPAAILRLAHEVYGAAPESWLVTMGGESFEIGERLSDAGQRAVAKAVAEVLGRS